VVDASVALKWLWDEEGSDRARRYARGAIEEELCLLVPTLFWYEVANALRYAEPAPAGRGDPGGDPWQVLLAVPLETVGFLPPAYPRIEALARRLELTVYDASYIFLAQLQGVPLLTADQRLALRCADLPWVWPLDRVEGDPGGGR
jgi:predicted nucleic acid-binding protein